MYFSYYLFFFFEKIGTTTTIFRENHFHENFREIDFTEKQVNDWALGLMHFLKRVVKVRQCVVEQF